MESHPASQVEQIRKQYPPDWEVPEFRIEFWDGKTSDYCVVIPVINEGPRIRQFVRRLKESNIHASADVIIVDGGSTDGSLEANFLRAHGIRGLFTKIGRGKLGAQLRVAYSFAIISGYMGVVTIDGNNKDDPAEIPAFISLLQAGYDFVQASRFIPGGKSVNTPLVRSLAIRFIHAPVLRRFSGFRWTDTTQGFRAYSTTLLSHPDLSLFRSIFESYELLVFLSYRAPLLNLHCIEVPTTRTYPSGATPTKISFFRGNLDILMVLFSAVLNRYNPERLDAIESNKRMPRDLDR